MARIVQRPITATLQGEKPHTFVDRGFTYTVEIVIDRWMESGQWVEGEPNRWLYTVRTTDDGMYDLECSGDSWTLYRVWD